MCPVNVYMYIVKISLNIDMRIYLKLLTFSNSQTFVHVRISLLIVYIVCWSLEIMPSSIVYGLVINYGEGGYKMGKSWARKLLRPPPPQDRLKLFAPPTLLKAGNFLCPPPPFTIANTSSARVKTTSKFLVPYFSMAKTFSATPLFFCRGKTSLAPPPPPVLLSPPLRNY